MFGCHNAVESCARPHGIGDPTGTDERFGGAQLYVRVIQTKRDRTQLNRFGGIRIPASSLGYEALREVLRERIDIETRHFDHDKNAYF